MMVSVDALVSELAAINAPTGDAFTVRQVPDADGYLIGRGPDGVVALMTPADPKPAPPTRLRTLSLAPRVRCLLEDAGSTVEEEHGLVQLHLDDDSLLAPFLAVVASVIRLLGPSPAPGEVSSGMQRLVQIFDPSLPPRGSVLGLWAELLVITGSTDAAALVDAWHATIDARFDFAAPGSRLEVKCTSSGKRSHMFGLEQVQPVLGSVVRVASVITTETNAGTSIAALVARLEAALPGDAPRQMKVHEQVAATLGNDWARHSSRQFDEDQGAGSLAIVDPADIPQVGGPPAGVSGVHFTADCSDVPHDSAPPGLAALVRSPAH